MASHFGPVLGSWSWAHFVISFLSQGEGPVIFFLLSNFYLARGRGWKAEPKTYTVGSGLVGTRGAPGLRSSFYLNKRFAAFY